MVLNWIFAGRRTKIFTTSCKSSLEQDTNNTYYLGPTSHFLPDINRKIIMMGVPEIFIVWPAGNCVLTQWSLRSPRKAAAILYQSFSNTHPLYIYLSIFCEITLRWLPRWWLVNIGGGNDFGGVRQQTITCASVYPALCDNMVSLGHSGLNLQWPFWMIAKLYSRLVLLLSLPNPLKWGIKSRMKM